MILCLASILLNQPCVVWMKGVIAVEVGALKPTEKPTSIAFIPYLKISLSVNASYILCSQPTTLFGIQQIILDLDTYFLGGYCLRLESTCIRVNAVIRVANQGK